MKKSCELCKSTARVFCDSDQASLCWDCDSKVHTANFLVEKHSRNLLCHVCQSPTPWNASGAKLGRTVSICVGCVDRCGGVKESRDRCGDSEEGGYDRDVDTETETETDLSEEDDESESDEDDDEEDEVLGEDEDGDNQVVPATSTPPPAVSSSDDDGDSTLRSQSRFRYTTVDLGENQSNRESTSRLRTTSPAVDDFRPLKRRKTSPVESESRTAAILESIKRFHDRGLESGNGSTAATVAEICKLSKDAAAATAVKLDG